MVFRVCRRYIHDRDEAEDLTQETFLKIDRHLESFREDAQMSSWIYRIAVNTCLDHLRTRKRRASLAEEHFDPAVEANLTGAGDRELAKVDLDRILGEIKPEIRQILFLTLAEGLTHKEAGGVVGKSQEAIAKILSRFKKGMAVRMGALPTSKGTTTSRDN
ncbi:MAG: polymerase subunit sigma-70 [Fibrobacteres bacterium]|nr:polymerase subunit sigma-70 [Fibrobacterota bacterium]